MRKGDDRCRCWFTCVCVCVWDRDLRMWYVKEGGTDPEQQTLWWYPQLIDIGSHNACRADTQWSSDSMRCPVNRKETFGWGWTSRITRSCKEVWQGQNVLRYNPASLPVHWKCCCVSCSLYPYQECQCHVACKNCRASILTLNLICRYIPCDETQLFDDWVVFPKTLKAVLASLPRQNHHKAVFCFALNLFISSTNFTVLMWYMSPWRGDPVRSSDASNRGTWNQQNDHQAEL